MKAHKVIEHCATRIHKDSLKCHLDSQKKAHPTSLPCMPATPLRPVSPAPMSWDSPVGAPFSPSVLPSPAQAAPLSPSVGSAADADEQLPLARLWDPSI